MSHKTVASAAARLFNHCTPHNYPVGFSKHAKKVFKKPTEWFMPPAVKLFDETGMFETEEEIIKAETMHDRILDGRGPPKKGMGKKALLAQKALAEAEKKAKAKKK
ncbi:ADAM18 [Acrasis kona]|uniref:ADAM18 n=1 Tax=Acrasis kona TaxID=1008807 RepID=A0AAW2YLI3_9EUKA